jgi:hypothetical protein
MKPHNHHLGPENISVKLPWVGTSRCDVRRRSATLRLDHCQCGLAPTLFPGASENSMGASTRPTATELAKGRNIFSFSLSEKAGCEADVRLRGIVAPKMYFRLSRNNSVSLISHPHPDPLPRGEGNTNNASRRLTTTQATTRRTTFSFSLREKVGMRGSVWLGGHGPATVRLPLRTRRTAAQPEIFRQALN